MTDGARKAVAGKAPVRATDARLRPEAAPSGGERIEATLVLRSRASPGEIDSALETIASQRPTERSDLSTDDFAARFGVSERDLEQVARFAEQAELEVVRTDRALRLVTVAGAASAFERALGVEFTGLETRGTMHRVHTGDATMPAELGDLVEEVLGLDNLPLFERPADARDHPQATAVDKQGPGDLIEPVAVAKHYGFPADSLGKGRKVAIVLLGGGFYDSDIERYFAELGLDLPPIAVTEVDGQRNDPVAQPVLRDYLRSIGLAPPIDGPPETDTKPDAETVRRIWWTIEATIDVQLVGAFANAASIRVYFAPNSARGKLEGLAAALSDPAGLPDVVSCSWGQVEANLTPAFIDALNGIFAGAALRGVSICYSSGDKGANPGADGRPRVQFPATSPYVLACGGTTLEPSSDRPEDAWNESSATRTTATGGGFSDVFPVPAWQEGQIADPSAATPPGRGIPDVAGKADIGDGYAMLIAGLWIAMGGTSAAAPMWAGLLACANESLGARAGWINPLLYHPDFASVFTDITAGNNGTFDAGAGWDACTGQGSPRGEELIAALRGARAKG